MNRKINISFFKFESCIHINYKSDYHKHLIEGESYFYVEIATKNRELINHFNELKFFSRLEKEHLHLYLDFIKKVKEKYQTKDDPFDIMVEEDKEKEITIKDIIYFESRYIQLYSDKQTEKYIQKYYFIERNSLLLNERQKDEFMRDSNYLLITLLCYKK